MSRLLIVLTAFVLMAGCKPTAAVTPKPQPVAPSEPIKIQLQLTADGGFSVVSSGEVRNAGTINVVAESPPAAEPYPMLTIWSTEGCGVCKDSAAELAAFGALPFGVELRDVSFAPKWIRDLGSVPVYTWPGRGGVTYTIVGHDTHQPKPGRTSATELLRLFAVSRKN